MDTDTPTLSIESALEIYEIITKIRGCTRAHRAIWQRLLVGQWYQALELARANSLEGTKTARGLSALLLSAYRARKNGQARLKRISDYIELMTTEAESGLNLRALFTPLADQWELEPAPDEARPTMKQKRERRLANNQLARDATADALHAHARAEAHTEPPAPVLAPRAERVIIA